MSVQVKLDLLISNSICSSCMYIKFLISFFIDSISSSLSFLYYYCFYFLNLKPICNIWILVLTLILLQLVVQGDKSSITKFISRFINIIQIPIRIMI